jgi:hypothetical protein
MENHSSVNNDNVAALLSGIMQHVAKNMCDVINKAYRVGGSIESSTAEALACLVTLICP